ncbi:MAG: stilbene synthase, partial [Verrucomicrobiaceae bacterium]
MPEYPFTQADCWRSMQDGGLTSTLKPRSAALVEKILTGGNSGIATRNFAVPDIVPLFS